jgi:RIO kinase 1
VLYYEGILLMKLVLDADGHPAPRLIEAHPTAEQAAALYADLRTQAVKMLCVELIHGDLSPYNVLLGAEGPTLIDFPQVVSAAHNSTAESFFKRDIENLRKFLADFDPALHQRAGDAQEIWRAYVRRELTPDFVPSGKVQPEAKPHAHPQRHGQQPGARPQHGGGQKHPPRAHGQQPPPRPHGQQHPPRPQGQQPHPPRPHGQQPHPPRPHGQQPHPPRPHGQQPHPPRPHGQHPHPPRPQGQQPHPPRPQGQQPHPPRPQGQQHQHAPRQDQHPRQGNRHGPVVERVHHHIRHPRPPPK